MNLTHAHSKAVKYFAITGISVVLVGVSWSAENSYTRYDTRGSLMLSQSLLQSGTVCLDEYESSLEGLGYRIEYNNGHAYYYFPIGTSLFSIPAVAVATWFGLDMADSVDEGKLQRLLAALSVAATFVLLFAIARRWLKDVHAIAIAALLVLGTPLISTMATALWSFNFTVVFIMVVLLLVTADDLGERLYQAALLGACLFGAFLCRPTAAIPAALILLYLAVGTPRAFLIASAVVAVGAFLLVSYSWTHFQSVLPSYYLSSRVLHTDTFSTAVVGHLISPSRGIFVFSPFLAVSLLLGIRTGPRPGLWGLFWLGWTWFCLHLIVVSRFPHWWGGHGYGPRLMTDVMPGIALLVILSATAALRIGRRERVFWVAGLVLCAGFSIFANARQGLFNVETQRWNSKPEIDHNVSFLFDWRFPQFLASPSRNEAKMEAYWRTQGVPSIGPAHDHSSVHYLDGWLPAEDWGRWHSARDAYVSVTVPKAMPILRIRAASYAALGGAQRLQVSLDEQVLGDFVVTGADWEWHDLHAIIPANATERPIVLRLTAFEALEDLLGQVERRVPIQAIWFDASPPPLP